MSKKLLRTLKLPLLVLVGSFFISLLFVLIHIVLTINIINALFGLTFLISSVISYFVNQNLAKNKYRLNPIKQVEVIENNQAVGEKTVDTIANTTVYRTVNTDGSSHIDTGGGNYNEEIGRDYIGRDYIGRDSVTKNTKNLSFGNRKVEIKPNNIVETFDELKYILTQSITQSSNALEAISEFAKELTEELRNRPEMKVCFGVDENISIQELVNKVLIDLLTNSYNQINVVDPSYQATRITQFELSRKINFYNDSEFIEHFEYRGNGNYYIIYKGYTVHLYKERLKRWLCKIKRNDSTMFEDGKRQHSRNIYFAIGRAIDKIDNEIDTNWKKSMSNSE